MEDHDVFVLHVGNYNYVFVLHVGNYTDFHIDLHVGNYTDFQPSYIRLFSVFNVSSSSPCYVRC